MQTETTSNKSEAFSTERSLKKAPIGAIYFLRRHLLLQKFPVVLVLFIGIVNSVISLLVTLMIGEFFILQFKTQSSKGKLLQWLGIHIDNLNMFFILLAILLTIKFIAQYLEKYFTILQGELFSKQVRESLFIAQIKSTNAVFSLHSYGNYLLRYSNDLKSVQQYFTKGFLAGARDLLFLSIGLYFFFLISPSIGKIVSMYFLLVYLAMVLLAKQQQSAIKESRNKRSSLLAFVTRSFQRFGYIKENQQEEKASEKFLKKSDELFNANRSNARWESIVESLVNFFHIGSIGLILALIAKGTITVQASDGLSCVLLLLLFQGSVKRLFKVPSVLKKGSISLEKISTLINDAE
ncbi:MAG: ABC transporter transmembrane domain-containing protein [Chitinophagaceae bacterium]